MKLVLTGGGTGGHIYPALAIAATAKGMEKSTTINYIGSRDGMEATLVPEHGLDFTGITTKKLRKVMSVETIAVLLSLAKGYSETRAKMLALQPDCVIGTGGYVAGAAVRAAVSLKIPTLILAPDAVPGRTNLWLSKHVDRVCGWLGDPASYYPSQKVTNTGLPVRPDIRSDHTKLFAREYFGLQPDKFTVLTLGGSQGAAKLNELVLETLNLLPDTIQILHQTGPKNFDEVRAKMPNANSNYVPRGYFNKDEASLAFRAADVIFCRSGVSTLAEATVNHLPLIMTPLPTAYADHQTENAKSIVAKGAGILASQVELTSEKLSDILMNFKSDEILTEQFVKGSIGASKPNAASDILDMVAGLIR